MQVNIHEAETNLSRLLALPKEIEDLFWK